MEWAEPPADVAQAKAAYAHVLRSRSRRQGRKASAVAMAAVFLCFVLLALLDFAALAIGIPLPLVIAGIAFELVVLLPVGLVAAARAGRALGASRLEHASSQFGLAAFASGYAASRGLREEDREELRHRLDPPLPGAPLRAWHGPLGGPDGPVGRLVIWIDRTELGTTRYALLAAVPDPGGDLPATPGPYRVARSGGTLVLIEPVDAAGRSAAALDAIASAARYVSLQERDMLQAQPT